MIKSKCLWDPTSHTHTHTHTPKKKVICKYAQGKMNETGLGLKSSDKIIVI